jgi:pyruvate/2-oxoglutarate dehydrogenase complex dihydrolipoamide dehydrogenase (E3) component
MAEFDLVVVGGGAAGLAAARTGTARGARVALISDAPIGGDCTFTGCVPSKTLIEHANRGATFTDAIKAVQQAVTRVAATESAQVLAREGIDVLAGHARLTAPRELDVDGRRIRARSLVLATGSRPAIPAIPGLADVPYLTNENVFDLTESPDSLAILGGGATGCELAQAFHRLGVDVTVIEAADRLLPSADPDASRVIGDVFAREGIGLRLGTTVTAVEGDRGGVRLKADDTLEAHRLLVATGRVASTNDLGLAAGGVHLDRSGCIRTDRHLATTAPGVYAAGDVTGHSRLTHAAYAMGHIAATNALSRRPHATYTEAAVPHVIFTDPEIAHVGRIRARRGARIAYLPMSELDRAITAEATDGFVKLLAGPRRLLGHRGGGRVLAATIVAARAGEMIHEPALAIRTGMFTGRLAQTTHAYPTWSTAIQQAAAQFFGTYGGRTAHPFDTT